jgi:hypothetical protein
MDGRDSEAKGDISIENSQNPSERLFQKIYLIGYAFKWPPDTINPEDRQEKNTGISIPTRQGKEFLMI